jgi:hypothetical protein
MKLNQAIITAGLVSLNLLFVLPLAAQAQSNKQSYKYNATLQSVKNKITKGRRVRVVDIYKSDVPTFYQSYPKNRPFRYTFALDGSETVSVLNSVQLLTASSRDIINNCTNVSQVIFGLKESDAVVTFGLMPRNKIGIFDKCIEPGTSGVHEKLPWGYVFCM